MGAWLLAFPSPFTASVSNVQAALLALGSATLWAAGTVLGRAASAELKFTDLTALRFALGFVTLAITTTVTSTPLAAVDRAVELRRGGATLQAIAQALNALKARRAGGAEAV